jgi:hypothetical protein
VIQPAAGQTAISSRNVDSTETVEVNRLMVREREKNIWSTLLTMMMMDDDDDSKR